MKKIIFSILVLGLFLVAATEAEMILHYDFAEDYGDPNVYDKVGDLDAELNMGVIRVTDDPDFVRVVGAPGLAEVKTDIRAGEWLDAPMEGGDFTMAVLWKKSDAFHPHESMIGWDALCLGSAYGKVWSAWTAIGDDNAIYYNEIWYDGSWEDTDWHHVAMTYDNSTYTRKIYFDGWLLGTDTLDPTQGAGQGHWERIFVVGGRQDYYAAEGLCADAKVWNTVLTAAEIEAEYDALMAQQKLQGDVDGSGCVNMEDFSDMAQNWLEGSL